MNLATILIIVIMLYVFTKDIATRSEMNRCMDKLEIIKNNQRKILDKLEGDSEEDEG